MSFIEAAFKQAQPASQSEHDHLAYKQKQQLLFYRRVTLTGGFCLLALVTGSMGYMSGKWINTEPTNNQQQVVQEQATEKETEPSVSQPQAPIETATEPKQPEQQPTSQQADEVSQVATLQTAAPAAPSQLPNNVEYHWVAVQVGVDTNGQPVYERQMLPILMQPNNTTVKAINTVSSQPVTNTYAPQQSVQQVAATRVQLESAQAMPEPLTEQVLDRPQESPQVSDALRAAFEQAVVDTDPNQNFAQQGENEEGYTSVEFLPTRVQNQLPDLLYQQHIYTTDPSKRWIKVNDKELYEGESLGRLRLLEITLEHSVFSFGGYEFTLQAMQDWEG